MRDDPPGINRHEAEEAAAIVRGEILIALTVYCELHVASRRGWTNDVGLSCDELGCMICNGDGAKETAEFWLSELEEPTEEFDPEGYRWPMWNVPPLPFDPSDQEELNELLEQAEELGIE